MGKDKIRQRYSFSAAFELMNRNIISNNDYGTLTIEIPPVSAGIQFAYRDYYMKFNNTGKVMCNPCNSLEEMIMLFDIEGTLQHVSNIIVYCGPYVMSNDSRFDVIEDWIDGLNIDYMTVLIRN